MKIIKQQEVLGKEFKVYGDFNNPLFLAKDVADWIEHSNSRMMLQSVDDNEKVVSNAYTLGGEQEQWFLTEDGLYEVLMQSRKPIAKQFKIEVKKILKSIRLNEAYITGEKLEEIMNNPDVMISLLQRLKQSKERTQELEISNSNLVVETQIMLPKADYFDELVDRNLLTNFRETAKQLEVKEKVFITFLITQKYVYRDKKGKLQPFADKNIGLFELKECFNEKTKWSGTQTLITPKGRETFRLLMKGL